MNLLELFALALGLSMDAFAVAVCIGLALPKADLKSALIVGIYFGGFQAAMPLVGYLAAYQFAGQIAMFSHWIVFGLLCFLGLKMLWGSRKKADDQPSGGQAALRFAKMLPAALATSVDAMAVGVSFAFLYVDVVLAVVIIGVLTLAVSMCGVKIGNMFGAKFKSKAEMAGGIILVLMGVRVLLGHFMTPISI